MTKEFWYRMDSTMPVESKAKIAAECSSLCNAMVVDEADLSLAKKSGLRGISPSEDADVILIRGYDEKRLSASRKKKPVAVEIQVASREDQALVIKAAEQGADYLIVSCADWKVIPLENLIAAVKGKSKLVAEVSSSQEAKLALETLELGSDGVLLKNPNKNELAKTAEIVRKIGIVLPITTAKLINIRQIGSGARVCVDTCDLMKPGEGMLIGSQSSGLFLVQSETHENPHVETRPFRVNAGPVSLYVLVSPTKTRYLSELKAGDEVLIVDSKGATRVTNIARVKIEWRPMTLIEAEHNGRFLKTIAQTAETIRFVTREGAKAVTELRSGDELLVRVEEGGRHFGTLVREEMVIEK